MAGASMKDIKLRIKSVESTMQITKAMELVASSKLRKAKERQERCRPYFMGLQANAGKHRERRRMIFLRLISSSVKSKSAA